MTKLLLHRFKIYFSDSAEIFSHQSLSHHPLHNAYPLERTGKEKYLQSPKFSHQAIFIHKHTQNSHTHTAVR